MGFKVVWDCGKKLVLKLCGIVETNCHEPSFAKSTKAREKNPRKITVVTRETFFGLPRKLRAKYHTA